MNQPNPSENQRTASLRQQVAGLQQIVATQSLVLDYVCKVAGIVPQTNAIKTTARAQFQRQADAMNPAQPVPDPPSEAPVETTEQAATPEAYDDPQNPGQTPGSVQHLPADATGTVMDPGTTLPTAPYNNLVDVQAPVAGTEGPLPIEQVRTETDVRVGDPNNPQTAFPWQMGGQATASQTGNRTMASLHLARLRMQAGTAPQGKDDIQVQASIEGDQQMTMQAINSEISTLTGVIQAAASRTAGQRPAGVVPRAAAVQRTTPSLVGQPEGLSTQASQADDSDAEDLFD